MELYLVRHGQRYFGKRYDELQPEGIEQSKKVGDFFKNKPITKVFCSPQERAKETLKYILPHLAKDVNVTLTKELKQQGISEEVGCNVMKEIVIKHETNEQTRERAKRFINYLLKSCKDDNILLVTHKRFCQFTVSNLLNTEAEEIKIPSASITYFAFNDTNKVNNFKIAKIVY